MPPDGARSSSGGGSGAAPRAARPAAPVLSCRRRRDDVHDDADGAAVARQIRCTIRREARARDRSTIDAAPSPGRMFCTRSGTGEAGSARSRPSASNRMTRRLPSCSTACGVGGATSSVTRASDPCGSIAPADARHADVADEQEPRGLRSSTRVPSDGASARGTKSTGTNQLASLADRRGGQRDQAPADRREALARRQHDRLRSRRDRQPAGERVFADGQLKQRLEIVEREHFLAADEPRSQRLAALGRDHGVGRGGGRRLCANRAKRKEQRACSQGKQVNSMIP